MKVSADMRLLIYFGIFACISIGLVALFFKFFLKKFEFKISKSDVSPLKYVWTKLRIYKATKLIELTIILTGSFK